MARILVAWELGGDYGHLSRLLPVALELQRRGHEPLFAIRDLLGAEAILARHQLRWFQAPLWVGQITNLPPSISYPELLMHFGFLNARALTGICRAWRNLVDLLRPELLVLEHAPTALLATRGLELARASIGTGFSIPPASRPLPPFRWWQRENQARIEDSENRVCGTSNEVLFTLGAPPMGHFSESFACDAEFLCTFPELDHYPLRPDGKFLGPIFSLGQGIPAAWPAGEGPKVFAYLKPGYEQIEKVLQGLHALPARVLAHVPGAAKRTAEQYSTSRMRLTLEPVDMEEARAGCDLAVCHGGAGTTSAMLLAGKPLLLLPMQMEQTMVAHRLESLGAANHVKPEGAGQFVRIARRALADAGLREAAQRFARAHAGYDQRATAALIADRCEALVRC